MIPISIMSWEAIPSQIHLLVKGPTFRIEVLSVLHAKRFADCAKTIPAKVIVVPFR